MTQTISLALQAHYQQSNLTLARCVRLERRDGQVFGLTDHDQDLLIDNLLYRTAVACPTVLRTQSGLSVNTVEIEGIVDVLGIERTDIEKGLWDHARMTVFEVNYQDISQGHRVLLVGFWGETQLSGNRYTTELRSIADLFQKPLGDLYSTTCRATLGDARCGVEMEPFTHSGTVTAVVSGTLFEASPFSQASGYFQGGVLTWQSGSYQGRSIEIKTFEAGGRFQLVESLAIQIGDTLIARAGCDKTLSTCKKRFQNVLNFRGEPLIPDNNLQF